MRAARLQDALERPTTAIRDVETELAAMKAEQDPLASHIFISRRSYRNVNDTKSGKRREMTARLSFDTACELGFRGSLDEWERLMGAVARRRTIWIVDAHRDDGKRFVARADEKLTAFLELEAAVEPFSASSSL